MVFMSQKTFSFKPKPWINDSVLSKTFTEFRASDAGLGNRAPLADGNQYKVCILCYKEGKIQMNNECHILTQCDSLKQYRDFIGLSAILDSYNSNGKKYSDIKCVQMFLGADFSSVNEYMRRSQLLFLLREKWKSEVKKYLKI